MEKIIKGIGASTGIAIGKAYLIQKPNFDLQNPKNFVETKKAKEILKSAVAKTCKQLEEIKNLSKDKIGQANAELFDAHIQIANDPAIFEQINTALSSSGEINLAQTVNTVFDSFRDMFKSMSDPYFKERASDVTDVKERILANILNVELPDLISIHEPCIVVSSELTPSQTALLNKKFIQGIIVETGGRTSHTAIMARSLEIPAVVGAKGIFNNVKVNQQVALDGKNGVVDVNPDAKTWDQKIANFKKEQEELKKYVHVESKTLDGHKVLIEANVGNPNDAVQAAKWGLEGVGLYRTEFLYMDGTSWPNEEDQFNGYKSVLETCKGQMVVIRTLDIGGDKKLPYYTFDHEENPFLGNRAVRFCLQNTAIFKTQLRALARASYYGNLAIMFPMIATIDEFKQAKALFNECLYEVIKEGHKVGKNIQVGMMTEIPSAAILADKFAKYADFCSIGTNDLNQYTFACDRQNKNISYLYQPNCPSLLRLVDSTIKGCHAHKKWAGMCGEMAGDINSVPILLGLGLDAFSMSASSIPSVRRIINNLRYDECQELAKQALNLETVEHVNDLVNKFLKKKKLI